ncbi:unnamed protein product [Bursaphelenchus xylophilus]|uniref:Ubiquitin carboxyl-terminal hydrolase n=1 Tax=Bursaphelenchus xylophilus TaxID=6326 RepID=A0A1I7SMN3_BURXY|nr:unnamed protein product [Bursaphelenchus xylophilus]CAG9130295.1 unnamed protein product [Bursaphelenchus xylophilus]
MEVPLESSRAKDENSPLHNDIIWGREGVDFSLPKESTSQLFKNEETSPQAESAIQQCDEPGEESEGVAEEYDLRTVLFSQEVEAAFFQSRRKICGVSGIFNMGNTCYMNSAVQALAHCPPLRDFFCVLSGGPKLSGSCPPTDAIVSVAFRDLMNRLWSPTNSNAIRPTVFLFRIREKCAQFRGFSQQDAQEFIRCFLDVLHQELKYEMPRIEKDPTRPGHSHSSLSHSSTEEENMDSGMSTENESVSSANQDSKDNLVEKEELKTKPLYESVVNVVFDGQLVSTVKCLTCQHLSETNETFQDISLSIPSTEQLEKMREAFDEHNNDVGKSRTGGNEVSYAYWIYDLTARWLIWPWFSWINSFYRYLFTECVSLEDCLRGFFAADYLRGEDMYKCEKCNKLRNGVKFCKINAFPNVLCIHLKRFRHDSLYNSKINTRITFPLVDLDLTSFMDPDADDQKKYVYDLLSVVSHRGSSVDFGHYVAYCLNDVDGNWYEYDDSFVRQISEDEVLNCEAYVLFYQKREWSDEGGLEMDQ